LTGQDVFLGGTLERAMSLHGLSWEL